jgi:hypothetical protein
MRNLCLIMLLMAGAAAATAGEIGGKAQCVGGTIETLADGPKGLIATTNDQYFVFKTKKARYAVKWDRINLLEYGQRVGRRYALAVIVSPLLVMSKSRKHYLTIGFSDEQGGQQALIFQVVKEDIRSLLVSLEARTNMPVEYQDDEARRAGKG